jgi:hypothetical protein
VSHGLQEAARECGLARTQITLQENQATIGTLAGQLGTELFHFGFVGNE